jgi:hypothetical protein
VQWWVEFLPEVVRYVESRGFADPSADKILDAVEHHLVHHGDTFIADRWDKAPTTSLSSSTSSSKAAGITC